MRTSNVIRLVLLAAIWGGSFPLMKILVPPLGAIITAGGRALIAGLAFAVYFIVLGHRAGWRQWWKHYLLVAAVNSALPFALFAFAANHIPASYSVILNSTAPLFGAVFSAIWLAEPLSVRKVGGIALGIAGVTILAGLGSSENRGQWFWVAIVACLVGSICYGLAAVYIQKFLAKVDTLSISGATQLAAGLMLMPLIPMDLPAGPVTLGILGYLVIFALLTSGIAFLFYFRLIAEEGPTKALTVTFLMPPFGIVLGALMLGEAITPQIISGCGLTVAGTALVAGARRASR